MVGAVVGAYTGLRDTGGRDQTHAAVVGAIGGGIAASVSRFIQKRIAEVGTAEYLRMDESS
jgi:outer membrane lipoprotein SlyB